MRAIILAGGQGTRLRPYTATLPKPLVPVGDRAILEVVLAQLRHSGVTRVTLAVNHLSHLIMAYFGQGERWGVSIDYSLEDRPLSTIAPLKLIPDLPETFIVMNGDVLTDLDYRELLATHRRLDADITVATARRTSQIEFGVLRTDAAGLIVGFQEKPSMDFQVSMGVYVLNRRLLDIVPAGGVPYGFDNLMLDCIREGRPAYAHAHPGYWLDIGRPDDYAEANEAIATLLPRILPAPERAAND